jgi:outer membrane protein TolC
MNRYLPFVMAATLAASQPAAAQVSDQPERLTIDAAIDRGLDASHRLDEATARVDAAAAVTGQRHAALLPRVSGQAGYTRTNHVEPFGIISGANQLRVIYPDIPDNYRTRLDAQWPLYTGGRLEALERAAQIDASASGRDRSALQSDLRLEIARAYWAVAATIEAVRVLDQSILQLDAHLRDARNQLDAGLIPPNDVLTVEAQQARQQMLRIQAGSDHEVAEAALARLCGFPPGTRIETISPLEPTSEPSQAFDALLSVARENRADRRALSDRVNAASERIAVAQGGSRPTVSVGGGFDYARPNPRIFPRQGEWRESWDASVNVDWPLFDGGKAKADVAEASASKRAAEARLAEFDSQLALEIRQRLSEGTSGRAAVTAADGAIRSATEARRVVGERFAAGVATSTDVLDAQIVLLQAELERTRALTVVRVAEAGLARAVGQ